MVKCLNDRAKRIVTKPSVISKEKKHVSSVLVSNGYLLSFLQKIAKTRQRNTRRHRAYGRGFTLRRRLVRAISPLRTKQGVRAVLKSETTLKSRLVWPKAPADPTKRDAAYRITCECGKVCICETGRLMKDRIKEHDRDIRLAHTQTSVVSEHAHNTDTIRFGMR